MGCAVSTAIAVLVCKNKCSIDRLTSKMAFHPPSPPSYSLEPQPDGTAKLTFANREMQEGLDSLSRAAHVPAKVEVRLLRTRKQQTIPLFHFQCRGATQTLLWSHSNAMDCGEMFFFFLDLAIHLKVNVAAYDYSGYGASTGEPSESNANADVTAVYEYLQGTGVDVARNLVLYGQSIGSAPTLYLAARRKYETAGVVLHTPILSGLRFLIPPSTGFCSPGGCCSPVCVFALCDPFPNIKRVRRVKVPVLLIHGTADQTVDCSHTYALYERVPAPHRREPYIVRGAGHETVVQADPDTFFLRLAAFLASLPASGASDSSTVRAPAVQQLMPVPAVAYEGFFAPAPAEKQSPTACASRA